MKIKRCPVCGKRYIIGREGVNGERVCSAKCRDYSLWLELAALHRHMEWCIKNDEKGCE